MREQGYEVMPSLQITHVTNLSAPVFGPLGSVLAVLTCPYSERLDKKGAPDMHATLELVRGAADEISQRRRKDAGQQEP